MAVNKDRIKQLLTKLPNYVWLWSNGHTIRQIHNKHYWFPKSGRSLELNLQKYSRYQRRPIGYYRPFYNQKNIPLYLTVLTTGLTATYICLVINHRFLNRKSVSKLLESPEHIYSVKLIEREDISHDTRRFRFSLPTSDHVLGLPVGQHITLIANIDGNLVVRPYTPVSSDDDKGFFDLVVKVYFAKRHPEFPEGGKVSQYLENMKIGDTVQISGPNGLLIYKGKGSLGVKPEEKEPPVVKKYKNIGLIAGGTGITPCLQLIRQIFKDPDDETKLWLIYANRTEDDILLRKELEKVAEQYPNRMHIWYTVDKPKQNWKYSSGFINKDMIVEHMPVPSDSTCILLCGPQPMVNFVCKLLDRMGHPSHKWFVY